MNVHFAHSDYFVAGLPLGFDTIAQKIAVLRFVLIYAPPPADFSNVGTHYTKCFFYFL